MPKGNAIDEAFARGNALLGARRPAEALAAYDAVIAIRPDHADALNNRGNALLDLNRPADALANYDRALAINAGQAATHHNRGNALFALGRLGQALAAYDEALALKPDYADAQSNRGSILLALGRIEESLASFDKALPLNANRPVAHFNRANALLLANRLEEAVAGYEAALALKPDYEFLLGTLAHTRMKLCDWTGLDETIDRLRTGVQAGKRVCLPFALLALLDDPRLHKRAAEIYATAKFPKRAALGPFAPRARRDRIRVGYYSADFYNHATSYLMAELLERHDGTKFETIGFSFGPAKQDAMATRIAAAFHQFHDVRKASDRAVAQMSRDLGIDIAVDLKGYTQQARPGLFAEGCAPIQVSYLAYPGTLGADFVDYIIADKTVILETRQSDFTEKVIYLPHCYQVNDSKRAISDRVFARSELGLPDSGFVFCCFNNSYKILPEIFDIWMRLLKSVEGSVLWLLEDHPVAARNLRKEAAARGVDAARLVFAGRMPLDQHLAHHRQADLFLDTLPYNAHTTASDALWAGLPVLTCAGKSFASRVAASLLHTLGLPELVTESLEAYAAAAGALARDPARLAEIRRRLAANRLSSPLFDGARFARDIEKAFAAIYERHHAGLPPEGFAVG